MLPIGTSTTTYTIQPPLVNTTTPATSVVPVQYDNVAPSVSGSQVDNNNNNNNAQSAQTEEQAAATTNNSPTSQTSFTIAQSISANSVINSGAQAPFIAQLAGQDDTQEATVALKQYEKLIENSTIKYESVDAFKEATGPAGVYGSLLASSGATNANVQAAQSQTSYTASTDSAATTTPTTANTSPEEQTQGTEQNTATPQQTTLHTAAAPANQASKLAVNAYVTSATRVAFQRLKTSSAVA